MRKQVVAALTGIGVVVAAFFTGLAGEAAKATWKWVANEPKAPPPMPNNSDAQPASGVLIQNSTWTNRQPGGSVVIIEEGRDLNVKGSKMTATGAPVIRSLKSKDVNIEGSELTSLPLQAGSEKSR